MIPVPDGAAPEPRPSRLATAAFWLVPPLLCLALYWRGFTAWFRADDFAWLGTGLYIQNFHDFLVAIFAPMAQGTIRPLSERAFFMAGFSLFGLDALPFKIVIFATQFANLALVASIGARLSGLRCGGFLRGRASGCSTARASSRWAGAASTTRYCAASSCCWPFTSCCGMRRRASAASTGSSGPHSCWASARWS